MPILLWIIFIMTLGLFGISLWSVNRDYTKRQQELSPFSVVVVWSAYLIHAGFTLMLAFSAPSGRFGVSTSFAHIGGGFICGIGAWILFEGIFTFHSFSRMSGIDTSSLITSGIYRLSRNPQNLGWFFILFGIGVIGRSLFALFSAGVFLLVIHLYIVTMEEPYLHEIYGGEYKNYRRNTARYFGSPRNAPNP